MAFGRRSEPASTPPTSAVDALQAVRDREDVRQAEQELAAALAGRTQAAARLAAAHAAVEAAERQAGDGWTPGVDLPAALTGAHVERATCESVVRVAQQAVEGAEARAQRVRGQARDEYRRALEAAQRAAVARLDTLLLEVGKVNVELGLLHRAALANLGSHARMGVPSGAFAAVASDHGEIPMSVWGWRRTLGDARLRPRTDDADWVTVCAPLQQAGAFPSRPILPPEPARDPTLVALLDGQER